MCLVFVLFYLLVEIKSNCLDIGVYVGYLFFGCFVMLSNVSSYCPIVHEGKNIYDFFFKKKMSTNIKSPLLHTQRMRDTLKLIKSKHLYMYKWLLSKKKSSTNACMMSQHATLPIWWSSKKNNGFIISTCILNGSEYVIL